MPIMAVSTLTFRLPKERGGSNWNIMFGCGDHVDEHNNGTTKHNLGTIQCNSQVQVQHPLLASEKQVKKLHFPVCRTIFVISQSHQCEPMNHRDGLQAELAVSAHRMN